MRTAHFLSPESLMGFFLARTVLGAARTGAGSSPGATAGQGAPCPVSPLCQGKSLRSGSCQGSASPLRAKRLEVMEANFDPLISDPIRRTGMSGRPDVARKPERGVRDR